MATKKKKKTKKGVAAPAPGSVRGLILFGTVIIAAAVVVFFIRDLLGGRHVMYKLAAALGAGLLAGLSGNPMIIELPARIAELAGFKGAAARHLPTNFLAPFFSRELIFFAAACLMIPAALVDGFRKKWFKYEPAVVIPSLGLFGMAFALWARRAGALFYELFADFFNSPYLIGFVVVVTIALGLAKWLTKWRPPLRHWVWSVAAAPFIGFWVGYLDSFWMYALTALVFFTYLFLTNEDERGITAGAPVALLPLWFAKLFYGGTAAPGAMDAAAGHSVQVPWPLVAVAAAGFAAAHLWTARFFSALPAAVARALFFVLFFIFFVIVLISL